MPENQLSNIAFCSTAAYPAVRVQEKNLTYAHLLTQNLFAAKGEMTSVNQYLYQSWHIFEETCGLSVAEIFAGLAKAEMRHVNYLGRLIYLLGLNPCCYAMKNSHPLPWNGTYLNYTVDLKEMLKISILGEKYTLENYRKTMEQINDPNITAILERISLDEKLHVELLEQLQERI